jgi:hypothetical protein
VEGVEGEAERDSYQGRRNGSKNARMLDVASAMDDSDRAIRAPRDVTRYKGICHGEMEMRPGKFAETTMPTAALIADRRG